MSEDSVLKCFDPSDAARDFSNFRSRTPQSLEELVRHCHLVLGHFTSSTFLDVIRGRGLFPDFSKERAVEDYAPSDAGSVYLTARFDRFYLHRAVENHGGDGIIVVVKVERSALLPDESYLSQGDRRTLPLDHQLYQSLCLGAGKHPGFIAPAKFLGIYDDGAKLVSAAESR
jgi:hypothetical protein